MACATALAGFAMLLAVAKPAFAVATPPQPPSRYASIVIDAETGNVLYERNADLPRYPASLTKIMTLYLTFEALAAKKITVSDMLPVSAYAAGHDPSRLDLVPGTKLKVEDAIRAITTKSANDAACVLAERLAGGSESHFADMMTAKGKALGLKQTVFHNASGLPSEGHVTSARDLALLCKALIHDYPQYYTYFSTRAFDYHGTRFPNQNRFLNTYYGADGIKTGFVNASGHNLAASAVRGGKRLIAIVLGGDSQPWTREHATRLLDVSYAKIDPSLAMVATNASATKADTATPAAAVPAAPAQYATPAGAVTIASSTAAAAAGTSLPLPNATANLAAYAAAATAPKTPAGSVPPPPASPAPVAVASVSGAPTASPAVGPAKATAPVAHAANVPELAPSVPVIAAAAPEAAVAAKPAPTPGLFGRMFASLVPSHSAEAAQTALPAAAPAPAPAAAVAAPSPGPAHAPAPGPAHAPAPVIVAARQPAAPTPSPAPAPHAASPSASEAELEAKLAEARAQSGQPAAPAAAPTVADGAKPVPAKPAVQVAAPRPSPAAPAPSASNQASPEASGTGDESKAVHKDSQWSVQVGLFRDAQIARRRGEEARARMPLALRGADLVVGRANDGVHVASRIGRLTEQEAREACSQLQRQQLPCVVVPPGRPLIVATN